MKVKASFRMILIGAIVFALPLIAMAHGRVRVRPGGDCHVSPRGCTNKMKFQIKQIHAYLVAHVGPGDPVEFNPQPDPPGDPEPWYRKANEAYFGLTTEFADLAEHEADTPLNRPNEQRRAAFRTAVGEARSQLARLGQRSDRKTAAGTLSSLADSVNRVAQLVATR